MQTAIYAGLRNPGRDLAILNALNEKTATELAAEMRLSPSTIRAAARRVSELELYNLRLQGGVMTCSLAPSMPRASDGQPLAPTATSAEHSATLS